MASEASAGWSGLVWLVCARRRRTFWRLNARQRDPLRFYANRAAVEVQVLELALPTGGGSLFV